MPGDTAQLRALLRSENLSRLSGLAGIVTCVCDRDLRYLWLSSPFAGIQISDILGRRDDEFLPSEAATELLAFKWRALDKPAGHREVVKVVRPAGTIVYDISAQPLRDEDGRIIGLALIAVDTTRQQNTDEALLESERQFRATFEQAAVGIAHVALDGRFLRINDRYCDLLGYSHSEFHERTFQTITHPDDLDVDLERVRAVLDGHIPRYSLDKRYIRRNGSILWAHLTVSLVRNADGKPEYFVSVIEDISAKKAAEAELQEREARLRPILDTAPEALITIYQNGLIETFSRSAEILFGYRAEEVVGRNVSILMPSPYREGHDRYLEHYLRTGERRIIGIGRVVSARRKDGTIFPIELSVGEVLSDRPRLFTGFIRDLTSKQRMEQELRQAQKMEAVGQLSGGIAHDFNNLLTVILGNLEMLERRLSAPRDLALIREALQTTEYGAELTERLLAFSRRGPLHPQITDVGHLLESLMPLLHRTLGENIEISLRSTLTAFHALVDPGQLQNAILNLAINARDAMPGGGRLTIGVENIEFDQGDVLLRSDMLPGRYISISITDTGSGMSRAVAERAFEPFFTTKNVGAGTGLGLSMVYGFAKQSGGHAEIYSEPGIGTTVRLYLPNAFSAAQQETAEKAVPLTVSPEIRTPHGETIMVVEDEARVRRLTIRRLRELGYNVLEAANGPEALGMIDAHPELNLLFTDMIMPGGMNGKDLAAHVRAKRPGLKVLLTSGYAEPELIKHGLSDDTQLLRKPYTAAELARTLAQILGNEAAEDLQS